MVVLEQVRKFYGTRAVFHGIDLAVRDGEFVAIMGSSGSGKSTLLNLIGGMDRPDSGRILVDNEDVTSYTDPQLTAYRRKKIGFVFQFFNLLPNITVAENIEIPLLLNGIADRSAGIRMLLGQAGLADREFDLPSSLSGGEQQRVAILRALIHGPSLILADEPTGNLDSRTGAAIMDLLTASVRQGGKTLVLATHNQASAEYADRIIRIRDGELLPFDQP